MSILNPDAVTELIRSRRSVFPAQYTDQRIDDRIIEEILENANWAPTHKLTEPWRFVVFTGEGLHALGNFMADLYKEVTMRDGTYKEDKCEKLRKKPTMASHIISIGMHRDQKERVPEVEEIEAVACAVQNMYLTASAHGIGTYWGSGGITYFEEAKSYFGLEEKDKLLGFMYFGYPRKKITRAKRNPIEDKTRWIRS